MRFFCNNISFIKRLIMIVLLVIIIVLLMVTRSNFKYRRVFNENDTEEYIIKKGTNTNDKVVSFACNVDWGNEYIDQLLEIFDKYDVKITFFPTGRWAKEFPGVVKKLSSKGHEIGNNGFFNKSYDSLTYDNAYNDIKKADELLRELTAYDIKLFSPPSGQYNENVLKAAINLGYPGIVLSSIDTMDWKNDSNGDRVYKNVFNNLSNCDIILIHPTKSTVNAIGKIIEELLIQQYKIVPISEMLKK